MSVIWENEVQGRLKDNLSTRTVYVRSYCLQLAFNEYFKQLFNSPKDWKDHKKCNFKLYESSVLHVAYPKFTQVDKLLIGKWMEDNLGNQLYNIVTTVASTDGVEASPVNNTICISDTDTIFLAKIGLQRDWKSGCAICLTDNIMGTTCSCGHTEIGIFRPCGHSICIDPCFSKFIDKDTSFEQGRDYSDQNITCHLCRSQIEYIFRAERILVNFDVSNLVSLCFTQTDISQ